MHSTMHLNIYKKGGDTMKKKMTVLGALLLAVVATGYSVSGTYAKYVSAETMSDSARVAKWDYNMPTTLNLFSKDYEHAASSDDMKIVAPGAYNSYTFTIGGSSEVDAAISVDVIEAGEVVPEGYVASKTIDGAYDPIVYSLTKAGEEADETLLSEGTYAQLVEKLEEINSIGTYTISWKWLYYVDDETDAKDTVLGNAIAAAKTDEEIEKYTVRLTVKVTATQTPAAGAVKTTTAEEPEEPGTEEPETPEVTD